MFPMAHHRPWWRLRGIVALGVAVALCTGAFAAPSLARSHSAHPRRHQTWVLSPRQRRELAQHLRRFAARGAANQRKSARATSDLTSGRPFQRGDVFAVTSSGVQEYTPSGQLVQTIAGTGGARVLCFDPSGQHLILPGIGLFDSSGNLLPSNWASAPIGVSGSDVDCVADGFGNVYADGPSSPMTKYDMRGNALQTFNVAGPTFQFTMDLAPDECTMYESVWTAPLPFNGPFNVCTNTEESTTFSWDEIDDLRVLPNWQVVILRDFGGVLLDPTSGQTIQSYFPPEIGSGSFRSLALDPDGTSLWECCSLTDPSAPVSDVFRFDIRTGQILAQWPLSGTIAVYGPPLLGHANVAPNVDSNPAGTAEAFLTRVRYSGQMTRLHLYVDSSSTATQAIVGIYSNRLGHPGALQAKRTITNLMPGSWNYVDLPSMSVSPGQQYWIAVLGPSGGGSLAFRDRRLSGLAETSAQHNLTALPAQWSFDLRGIRLSGAMSGYGS